MEYDLLAPLFFIVIGLMAGAILKYVLRKTPLPYTVGLFAFGIIIGLLDRGGYLVSLPFLEAAVDSAGGATPDIILYVFLPILIFEAAYELDIHIFKKTLVNSTILSVPGVVIAMFLTAAILVGISYVFDAYNEWTWTHALMFGALISATDPVAVVALLNELGTSKRFSTLVDAESMLNDGTGIVLFMLFFNQLTGVTSTTSPYLQFLIVVAGGIVLGFFLARLCIAFITKVYNSESIVQISVIILSAYITFSVAEYLGVSGVIALVAFGLSMSYYGIPSFKPAVNTFIKNFWELAAFIANTLIFIIVGVVIAMQIHFTLVDILVLLAVYVGINLIRTVMIFIFYPLMHRTGYGISFRESLILSWGGLRGAVGLSLALMVSYAFDIPQSIREQILFLTAGVVALTLVLNATTMRWLLDKLKLNATPNARQMLDYSIKVQLCEHSQKYLESLNKREALVDADWNIVKQFLPETIQHQQFEAKTKDIIADFRLRLLDNEKSMYWNMYNEGVISQASWRKLNESVDDLYDKNGQKSLTERGNLMNFKRKSFMIRLFNKISFLRKMVDFRFHKRIVNRYDMVRGWLLAQKSSLKFLEEFNASDTLTAEGRDCLPRLHDEVEANITEADKFMKTISEVYPVSYRFAITQKAVRMLLRNQQYTIDEFMHQGLLSFADAEHLKDSLDDKRKYITFSYINKQYRKQRKLKVNA